MNRHIYRPLAISCCLAAGFFLAGISAEVPAGYYSKAVGKSKSDLKTALCEIILPHTEVSSYSALPSYFQQTDLYPESRQWWDMYSDIPFYAPSFKGLNREHSLPKSWWGGTTTIPAYVDLNHLYPSEAAANQAKSNYPLGIVTGTPKFDNGISKVGYGITSGGAPFVFEPDDEYKGDFARTYFYMVTCYQNLKWKYTWMTRDGVYPSLQGWAIDLLLQWHRDDPVSQKELRRNEEVYKIQNNRNPFIDYPELAELIWGRRVGEAFNPSSTPDVGGDPILVTPVQDMSLDFGQVAVGRPKTSKLYFKGQNLSGYLELTLAGEDKDCFSLSDATLQASLVNSDDGYYMTVTYTPRQLGTHTARLIVQDGGITGSLGIGLRGECLPTPTLSRLVATEPVGVTSDSYTATWLVPENEDEVVDYYIVTRNSYRNGSVTTEELLAEDNSLEITGFNESDYETYYVRSERLGYRSEPSNVITVTHTSIGVVDSDLPLAVECYEGFVRFRCGQPHSGAVIYDLSGKVVVVIPQINPDDELSLAPGVYFVVTAEHPSPVKILAR